ncbi:MAG: HEPN domain-containing protein, partial [Cyanobacteria bacterium J06649_4]
NGLTLTLMRSFDAKHYYLLQNWDALDTAFDKTHDLAILLDLCLPIDASWESLRSIVNGLTIYSVKFRYPGESASQADAAQAFQDCSEIRKVLKAFFELQDD